MAAPPKGVPIAPRDKVRDFIVMAKIGEGAFGAVYRVRSSVDKKLWALKAEIIDSKLQVLRVEVEVLTLLDKQGCKHFCKIVDKGRTDTFNFVVMTLVGLSLHDIRKAVPPVEGVFKYSASTALRTGIQCLEAVAELHSAGYLHRDIKPSNYMVGLPNTPEARTVYMIDFGLCRRLGWGRGWGDVRTDLSSLRADV